MKAYLTSIGEKTTDICKAQLERFGFEVVVLNKPEPWFEKYKNFLELASVDKQDCLRVDADIIPNKNIEMVHDFLRMMPEKLMFQFQVYDLYKNNVHAGIPLLYRKEVFDLILPHKDKLIPTRPEASAWRLPKVNSKTETVNIVMGMHGFFQEDWTVENARKNKEARGQIGAYDFALVDKLRKL